MLHAAHLAFAHPVTGAQVVVDEPAPARLRARAQPRFAASLLEERDHGPCPSRDPPPPRDARFVTALATADARRSHRRVAPPSRSSPRSPSRKRPAPRPKSRRTAADRRGPLGDPEGRRARAVAGRHPGRLHRHELRHGGEPRQLRHLGDARGGRSRAPAHDQQGLGRLAGVEPRRAPHRLRLAPRLGQRRAGLRAADGRRRGRARHRHADLGREPEVAARRQAHRLLGARGGGSRVPLRHEESARSARESQGQGAHQREPALPLSGTAS